VFALIGTESADFVRDVQMCSFIVGAVRISLSSAVRPAAVPLYHQRDRLHVLKPSGRPAFDTLRSRARRGRYGGHHGGHSECKLDCNGAGLPDFFKHVTSEANWWASVRINRNGKRRLRSDAQVRSSIVGKIECTSASRSSGVRSAAMPPHHHQRDQCAWGNPLSVLVTRALSGS
jgi:hypothetical protein